MSVHSAGTHAFSILARIQREDRFSNVVPNFKFDDIHVQYGEEIHRYAPEWIVEGMDSKEVAEVKELNFLDVMIYAMGGMHLVTSSITMSSYMASISSPTSKSILLRAYFSRSLAYWISRGGPILNVRSFFASAMAPTIPGPMPTPYASAFPKPGAPGALTPNPWLQIIQSALVHPDDHLGKFQSTLAYYGALYGGVTAGEFKGTEIDDGENGEGEKDQYWTNDPNYPSSFASLT
ncbi:hypothetical protein MSAN_00296200 [Mycena sanguinolenta]|uniref:Uncharacterized protein n=1 Tax=Mycena sanguinolenta TaxID=230812 RepID=A0A8H6Z7U8_9AGAR|nr:hypothetical protein MSAN_00296200 [Mycena sanguinolenta]